MIYRYALSAFAQSYKNSNTRMTSRETVVFNLCYEVVIIAQELPGALGSGQCDIFHVQLELVHYLPSITLLLF